MFNPTRVTEPCAARSDRLTANRHDADGAGGAVRMPRFNAALKMRAPAASLLAAGANLAAKASAH